MPKKVIFTAVDPNGHVHTRSTTTGKVYTHTVVYQKSKAVAIELARLRLQEHVKDGRYNLDCIANGKHISLMEFAHYAADPARWAKDVELSKERLAGAFTPAEYADRMVAQELADIEARDWSAWWNAGWCSRHDLAVKLSGSVYGINATILDAVRS